jgi:hypothetical protein
MNDVIDDAVSYVRRLSKNLEEFPYDSGEVLVNVRESIEKS